MINTARDVEKLSIPYNHNIRKYNDSSFNKSASNYIPEPEKSYFKFHLYRGIALYYLGDHDRAIRDFSAALRINWRGEIASVWIDRVERARAVDNSRGDLSI
jgi:tetratricopeptide (TPR) repeat protein